MNDYYKNLPRKWMGSGALFLNSESRILIVKPTYKDYWEIPGGSISENESPWAACAREVREELNLEIKKGNLLCIDYLPDNDEKGDRLMFIFDGGQLSESDISRITLQKEELSEFRFVSIDEAEKLLGERLSRRIRPTYEAKMDGFTAYLESGKSIF